LGKKIHIVIIACLLCSFNTSTSVVQQIKDTRSSVKALYLYTFATLIDWPQDYRKGDFVIGVFGAQEGVLLELQKKYQGKAIGSQSIQVKKFAASSEINNPHILYVTEDKSSQLTSLSTKLKAASTLLVSEKEGDLEKGAVINFVLDGSKQSYEIDKGNAKRHKLIIADKLSALAIRVKE
jgi:hypothetical protein